MTIITQKTAFYVGHIEQLPRYFCFVSQGCFVFGNDAQGHASKGAQQMAEHRLCPYAMLLQGVFPKKKTSTTCFSWNYKSTLPTLA